MLRDAVARFSKEHIAPHVRRMDDTATMDPAIIKGCFDNGTKGREIGILAFPLAPRGTVSADLPYLLSSVSRSDGN